MHIEKHNRTKKLSCLTNYHFKSFHQAKKKIINGFVSDQKNEKKLITLKKIKDND